MECVKEWGGRVLLPVKNQLFNSNWSYNFCAYILLKFCINFKKENMCISTKVSPKEDQKYKEHEREILIEIKLKQNKIK